MEDWMKTIIAKERDDELMANAYNNTYRVAVGEMTLGQLLDDDKDEVALMFNPREALSGNEMEMSPGITRNMIDDMIVYFIDAEEYEKCTKLQEILDGSREPTVKATASEPPYKVKRAPK